MIISASLSSSPVMAGEEVANTFKYTVDRFADVEILRYKVPGFEDLSLDQKKLVYVDPGRTEGN